MLLSALLPRDIIWRAVMILVMVVLWLLNVSIAAPVAILVCSLILIVSVAHQTYSLVRSTLAARPRALTDNELKSFRHVTSGLWGVTSLPPAMSQASTLLTAIILGPEIAGGVFVAERMARLVEVAQNGINQALAPEISAAYHSGRNEHVQRISALTAIASTAVSIAALVAFIVMGRFVLGLFDPTYDNATLWAVLLILSVGTALGCACGPANVLLQLTGGQHTLLRILIVAHVIGTIVTAGLTYAFGPIGAASGVAVIVVVEALGSVIVAKRDLKLDPSIFGLTPKSRDI
jgi:O-antigen/teichoic acid export membrane protein